VDIQKEQPTVHTRLFQGNRSQAARLPKDVAFPEGADEVTILREGLRAEEWLAPPAAPS
jgi:hypothetical protein